MIDQFRADRAEIDVGLQALLADLASAKLELQPAAAAVETCSAARAETNRLLRLVHDPDGTIPVTLYGRYRDDKFATSRPDIEALENAREVLRLITVKIEELSWKIEDRRDAISRLDRLIAAMNPQPIVATIETPLIIAPEIQVTKRKRIAA